MALSVTGLTKAFGNVKAVNGLDFDIPPGTCFGLLGPNGAGKSTTIEMLEGILIPDAGEIRFQDQPMQPQQFKKVAGIQFQSTALQDFLSVQDNLTLFASFYPHCVDITELIALCDLTDFLQQDASKLSGGQRQRLLLALALVNDPEVIFLDEPTTGLDPNARRQFWSLINDIKGKQKTIILTTHYMEEAYLLCDEIGIVQHGQFIARGTPDQLLKEHFNDTVLQLPVTAFGEHDWRNVQTALAAVSTAKLIVDQVMMFTDDLNATLQWLLSHQIDCQQLSIRPRSLEDLFVSLTQQPGADHV